MDYISLKLNIYSITKVLVLRNINLNEHTNFINTISVIISSNNFGVGIFYWGKQ